MEQFYYASDKSGLDAGQLQEALKESISGILNQREACPGTGLKKVLIVGPDFSRYHSNAGLISNLYYHFFLEMGCRTDILIAAGTHEKMSEEQLQGMYGDIPQECFIHHDFREDVVRLGQVDAAYVSELSGGLFPEAIDVEINRHILDESYDLILSVGQVVPHEVVGMANYSKNLFVGAGGASMINKSHMLGAVYGMERMMGKDHSPVREVFDYALTHFLQDRPIVFVQTVCTADGPDIHMHGLFIGDKRSVFEEAVELAQKTNIDFVQTGIRKCVVWLDPSEFTSTWIGNKAIYRTRMAIADGGQLIILAPGIRRFGEAPELDALIRKYGYTGRDHILEESRKEENKDLQENMSAAAHLIHGSSDGRFTITYAVRDIPTDEIRGVGFEAALYEEMVKRYDPAKLAPGYNTMPDGEEIFFIPNPALGLWINREKFPVS